MRRSRCIRVMTTLAFALLLVRFQMEQGAPGAPASLPPSSDARIGVYLTSYAMTKPGTLEELYKAADAGDLNAVVINVKNMHGELTYKSNISLAKQIGASTGRLELDRLLPDLRARGFYVIARQVLFYDPKLSAYLGRSNAPWVYPSDDLAIAYNLEIAQEVTSLGFDELQFDYIRYPDGGELVPAYDDRYAAVKHFLREASRLLSTKIALSVDVFGRVLWDWNKKRIDPIGQSLEEMAPYVDLVSPMLYPSHYHESYYRDDPYRVVTDALTSGMSRISKPFRPFLQTFDQAIPYGMSLIDYILAQIDAAETSGANGYLFWHPACEYSALYEALARRR